jgi:2-dehydro-3-deoxygluconokinase
MKPKVLAIGECMLELSKAHGGCWALNYGGDTFNTSVYLSRLGIEVAYCTALGNDSFSDHLKAEWEAEGIETTHVVTMPRYLPGLYAISNDADGERHFTYWRDNSAARHLFSSKSCEEALLKAEIADNIYFSGITLSLFTPDNLGRIAKLCDIVRSRGGDVMFDTNYRQDRWTSPDQAISAIAAIAPYVSIALPTFDDESQLYGMATPADVIYRWLHAGASEVVVKVGADGCVTGSRSGSSAIKPTAKVLPVDTTGAGDAFNAGYLAARLSGASVELAGAKGNDMAALTLGHRGAVIPKNKMSEVVMSDAVACLHR